MDPHPTPFAGKRRVVTAQSATATKALMPKAKSIAAAPKPKPIAVARAARIAKRSQSGNSIDAPQPRPTRRTFGHVRSSNVPAAEKPPTKLQKSSKFSPPPLPPAMQKPSRSLKKTAPCTDLEAKAKKRSQRVSFQVAAVESEAPGSREKGKSSADDAAGHTPMVAMKAAEKPARVVVAETPLRRIAATAHMTSWSRQHTGLLRSALRSLLGSTRLLQHSFAMHLSAKLSQFIGYKVSSGITPCTMRALALWSLCLMSFSLPMACW